MAKKSVKTITITILIVVFVAIFSWLVVSAVDDLLGSVLTPKAKLIFGIIGLSIAAVFGWLSTK